jgi:hypothetical protein
MQNNNTSNIPVESIKINATLYKNASFDFDIMYNFLECENNKNVLADMLVTYSDPDEGKMNGIVFNFLSTIKHLLFDSEELKTLFSHVLQQSGNYTEMYDLDTRKI